MESVESLAYVLALTRLRGTSLSQPAIVQGGNTAGLLLYLVGPGRANEHELPHVVAGTDLIMRRWSDWESLTPAQGYEVSKFVDQYMNELGLKPTGNARVYNHATGEVETVKRSPNHVWHCSLSLHSDEPARTDAQWQAIAQDFMDEMGFTMASSKPECRWVAIRHGPSKNGGDHIHIVANIVREDGTKWSSWQDQRRAQRACNMLEHKHGLRIIEAREHARGARADSHADLRASAARSQQVTHLDGRVEIITDRARLETRVRAAAVAARSEADFVRTLQSQGVRIRPRFAKGRTDVVIGYSVAMRPSEPGEHTQWYGGGRLARDLTLARLRTRWDDTPQDAHAAVEAWQHAWNAGRYSTGTQAPDGDWRINVTLLEAWHVRVAAMNPFDTVALADAIRDISGLLASAGFATDDVAAGRALMRASRGIGRHAQTHSRPHYRTPASRAASTAAMCLLASAHTSSSVQAMHLVREVLFLSRSLSDLYAQVGQTNTAQAILRDTADAWQRLHTPMPAPLQPAYRNPLLPSTRAASTVLRHNPFSPSHQPQQVADAVLASHLRDAIDASPELKSARILPATATAPDGTLVATTRFTALDTHGSTLDKASARLNDVMEQASEPTMFTSHLRGRTLSRDALITVINQPMKAAGLDPATPPAAQPAQAAEITSEQVERIRSIAAIAMSLTPPRPGAPSATPTPPPTAQPTRHPRPTL